MTYDRQIDSHTLLFPLDNQYRIRHLEEKHILPSKQNITIHNFLARY